MQVLFFRGGYSHELAVDIPEFDETPLVDRAQLQRNWPNGLGDLSMRQQVRANMKDVENLEAPAPAAGAASTPAPPAPEVDFATLLAAADLETGQRRSRVCAACHTFDDGGRNGVGPNLWAIVGGDIAGNAAFTYSPALTAEAGNWTYEKLDDYLANPAGAIPGNRMAFQGVRRASDRAAVIAYLRMQGSSQLPLPTPSPADDAGGE